MNLRGVALLTLLLFLPSVSAGEGEGAFTVRGTVTAAGDTTFEGRPLALYAPDTEAFVRFETTAPLATVRLFEKRWHSALVAGVESPRVEKSYDERTWTVESARISLRDSDNTGFLGLYPSAEATLSATTDATTSQARHVSTLGATAQKGDAPGARGYHQEITEPHVLSQLAGEMLYTSQGGMKVSGMDVLIESSTNVTSYETGTWRSSPTEITAAWLFIEFQAPASIAWTTTTPVEIATAEAALQGEGVLSFTPAAGELKTETGVYAAANKATTLEGRFRATMDTMEGGRYTRLHINGDITTSATLVQRPAAAENSPSGGVWFLVVGVAVGAAGLGTLAYGLHARRHPAVSGRPVTYSPAVPPSRFPGAMLEHKRATVARLLKAAESPVVDASQVGAFTQAADWTEAEEAWEQTLRLLRAARRCDPANAELAMREGNCLLQLGQPREAVSAFQSASELTPSGEANLYAAVALLLAKAPDNAAQHVLEALDRSPGLAEDVERDENLRVLLARADVRAAVERAKTDDADEDDESISR